jgi:F0F1-type ATP synthase alpha subunit
VREELREAGVLESVRILEASTLIHSVIAASAACSIAEAGGAEDVLVVIDSLRPHLALWRSICRCLTENHVPVSPEEEGSQQRQYYSRLVERASRRKEDFAGGGSVTLVLLQPSVSVLPSADGRKEVYTLSDFEGGGFTQTVCSRVAMLEEKGIPITQDVLIRVGIPLPGSDHPAAGSGQRSQQHLEELTSLVDGHIDLRESLASVGRVPPIDPSNSLTRIGVGSTKLRPLSTTPAMAAVNSAMRLNLAAASDPGNYDANEKTRAAAYMAALQQPSPAPLSLGEEVCVLYAASLGLLDGPVAAAGEVGCVPLLRRLLEYVDAAEPSLLPRISESGLLGEAAKERFEALIAEALKAS